MNGIERGAWAGILATGPMTYTLFKAFEELPREQRSPLPPATLSYESAEAVGLDRELPVSAEPHLTMISHFAYGAAVGALYPLLFGRAKFPPIAKGTLYGLGVWGASYLGWTPLMGFRARAPKMTKERNGMMILAHIVWGAALGLAEDQLRKRGRQMLTGERRAPEAE